MPAAFVLVAGLGDVIAALFVLIIGVAAYVLLQSIGNVIGKIGVGPFTVDVGSWFRNLGDSVANWCINADRYLWVHLTTLFQAVAYMLDHCFNAAVNAIGHAFDYADHIVTVTVPNAIDTAGSNARTEINNRLTDVANDVLNDTGAVGSAVGVVVAGALVAAEHYADHDLSVAKSYADTQLQTAKDFATGAVHDLSVTIGQQLSTLTSTVASDYTSAKDYASSQASAALSTARGLVNDAITETESVAQADATKVQTLMQTAIDHLTGTVSDLTTTVGSDLTAAEQYAQTQVASGLSDVVDTLNGTADVVGGAIAAAAGTVAGAAKDIITTAQNDATTALNSAQQALGDALAGVVGDVTGKAIAFNGDLSGIEGLLAGAITGVTAGLLTRVAKIEECYVGNCSDSANNFSNLLNDALGLASAVGVGGFLSQLINDPAGAEAEYSGAIEGIYQQGSSLLDDILKL